jgi:polysaccharide biosynthesis transport protein
LEDQVSGEDIINDKILYLKDKETRLSEMRGRYGEKHPDVKKLKREIAILNSEIQKLRTKQIANKNISEQAQPDNPIYINLKTQIVTAETEITNLKLDNVNLEKELKKLQEKVDRSPLVEKEYNDLTLDYNNAKIKYNELLDKLLEAKLSKGMEEKKQGERFTIIAPANLPIRPYKPNRIAIVLMGIVLAVGAVTGYIAVSERLDRTIKDERELASIAGLPILTSLSYIETKEEKKSRRRHYLFIAFSCCFILVIILLILNSLSLTILGLFN